MQLQHTIDKTNPTYWSIDLCRKGLKVVGYHVVTLYAHRHQLIVERQSRESTEFYQYVPNIRCEWRVISIGHQQITNSVCQLFC